MLTQTIPSYLYTHFADDEDLRAFVAAYNEMAQEYVTWCATVGLPVYTGPMIVDGLLDWVAAGLYGFTRPSLPAGVDRDIGPLNTYPPNSLALNTLKNVGSQTYYIATDDIFKRCITWNFFKGDGTVFNIRWLKRRIVRFLEGENGIDPGVNQTYQISVTFGAFDQVNISVITGGVVVTDGAMPNRLQPNRQVLNSITAIFTPITPSPLAPILKSAIDARVLSLPFQFTYVVS